FHQKLNFSRTSNRIQYCSSNGYSLKRELQQGMNKLNIGSTWGGFLILIKGKPNTNHGMFTLGTKLKKCVTIRETRTLP
ncbi:hypothetical protein, partial [Candidatus Phytoplasma fabacearum]